MKLFRRYKLLLISLIVLIGLTTAGVYEYATHVGRGWLRGEAFYEGRPTSYWREVIRRDLNDDWVTGCGMGTGSYGWVEPKRPQSWSEEIVDRIGAFQEIPGSSRLHGGSYGLPNGPVHLPDGSSRLPDGSPSNPVLRELREDDDPKVAGFASEALDGNSWVWIYGKFGVGERSPRWLHLQRE